MRRLIAIGALLGGGLACHTTTEPARDLAVTMTASPPTANHGDTITFVVSASGNNLVGVEIDFGDSMTDQYATGGAHIAHVTFKHVFLLTGTFRARAVVTDAVAGQKDATVSVLVN